MGSVMNVLTRLRARPLMMGCAVGLVIVQALGAAAEPVHRVPMSLMTQLTAAGPAVRPHIIQMLRATINPAMIPDLIEVLKHPDPELRVEAVQLLGLLKDLAAVQEVFRAAEDTFPTVQAAVEQVLQHNINFNDPDVLPLLIQAATGHKLHRVRRIVVRVLGHVADAAAVTPPLVKALEDQDSGVRLEAARALAAFDDPKALPVLLRALKDADPDVRAGAAEGLGTLHDPGTVPALVKASEDADRRVRLAVLGALLEIRSPLAVPALVTSMKEQDPELRRIAAFALGCIGDPSGIPALLKAMKEDPDPEVRQIIALLLGMAADATPDPKVLSTLTTNLDDRDPDVRILAAQTLEYVLDHSVTIPLLVHALKDQNYSVREVTTSVLSRMADPLAIPALLEAFNDPTVRYFAVKGLVKHQDPAVIPALLQARLEMTEDELNAIEVLAKGGSMEDLSHKTFKQLFQTFSTHPSIMPMLTQSMKDKNPQTRLRAVNILAELPRQAGVLALLRRAQQDPDPAVHTAAREALGELDAPRLKKR